MLEPFLALGLDLCPSLGRGGIGLQGQVVQVGAHSDSKSAVVVVNEWKPAYVRNIPQEISRFTHLALNSPQSLRSRSASPLSKRPARTTSMRFRSVERTSEINER
ncbi:hypothetical protein BO86DRAFT_37848 [Aspergillus japonicus CBS 114.51]|uniref:Uncharacterized protein n=1 Tax=Aspergillus japonicus CBS 114.51 TaxID=1448312 RepID=A0A8T8WKI1_ASPJA|nr:hypothetical protein BO86DRAFT_37848 [Aspergillus japonicus CBS 114.51]RAH75969.1 hypothetical protein BO86DRAFT_37848 [Aspergillus japonicus CBS 114.51]